jgi:hypothetical protein
MHRDSYFLVVQRRESVPTGYGDGPLAWLCGLSVTRAVPIFQVSVVGVKAVSVDS